MVRDGLRVPLSAPRSHPGERLLHALCIADVGLRYEARGVEVFTEREVRFLEGAPVENQSLFASLGIPDPVDVDGAGIHRRMVVPIGSKGRVHYPDLVMRTKGGLVAVEVEVTVKTPYRMRELLRGMAASRVFAQYVYVGTDQVISQLVGTVSSTTGEWVDGLFQDVRLGPPGEWDNAPNSRYRVQRLTVSDTGAAYRLDMRQVGDGMWVPKREWTRLREHWAADGDMGRPAKVPFLRWWHDVYVPLTQERNREAAHAAHARLMPDAR